MRLLSLAVLATFAALTAACDVLSPDPEVLETHQALVRRAEGFVDAAPLGAALIHFQGGAVRGVEADGAEVLFRREGDLAFAALVPLSGVTTLEIRILAVEGRGYGDATVAQAADRRNFLYAPDSWVVMEPEVEHATN